MFINGKLTTVEKRLFEVSKREAIDSLVRSFGFEKSYVNSFDGQDGFSIKNNKLYYWESGPGYASETKVKEISDDPMKVKLYTLLTEAKKIIHELDLGTDE